MALRRFVGLWAVVAWGYEGPLGRRGQELPTARSVLAMFSSRDAAMNASHPCAVTARRLGATRFWDRLDASLDIAASPAVMVFSNAAYHALLHNFLCALVARQLDHVLDHAVVWCADDASRAALATDWSRRGVSSRALSLSTVWTEDAAGDAPFNSASYAKFASVKAVMPWAAAVLGYDALVQDADVVWRADVLAYLELAFPRTGGAVMADSNRVDVTQRPCRRSEAGAIAPFEEDEEEEEEEETTTTTAKRKTLAAPPRSKSSSSHQKHHEGVVKKKNVKTKAPLFLDRACAAYRCRLSVNGGFVFARARPGPVTAALQAWAARCSAIHAARENQPSFVASLQEALVPTARGCTYAADPGGVTARATTWRPPTNLKNSSTNLVVLNLDLFVSGRRAAFARAADARGALLAFHCNFRFGWRAKCETLRGLGMLHIGTDDGNGDVCARPPNADCDPAKARCSAGQCRLHPPAPSRSAADGPLLSA